MTNDNNAKLGILREIITTLYDNANLHMHDHINRLNLTDSDRLNEELARNYHTQMETLETVLRTISELERV